MKASLVKVPRPSKTTLIGDPTLNLSNCSTAPAIPFFTLVGVHVIALNSHNLPEMNASAPGLLRPPFALPFAPKINLMSTFSLPNCIEYFLKKKQFPFQNNDKII